MTIDEVIENLKCDIEIDMYIHDIAPQIAEWLEELKHYKLGECMNDCEHYDNCSNYIYSKGYNKAIDDFVKELKEYIENKEQSSYIDELNKGNDMAN